MNLCWNEALVKMKAGKRIVADFMPANDYWTCNQQGKVMNSNGAIINTKMPEVQYGEYRELITQESFNVSQRIQFVNLINDFYGYRVNDPEYSLKKAYELIEYDLSEEAKALFKAMDVYFTEEFKRKRREYDDLKSDNHTLTLNGVQFDVSHKPRSNNHEKENEQDGDQKGR